MDSFSYLSVFISIILGLGVTHLLTGTATLIRLRAGIRMWWPTPLWMATTFLIQVQTWWAMFKLRDVRQWSFAGFFIVLLQPVAIFMMAALIVPRAVGGVPIDLKEDYYREYRWFFAALLLALLASLSKDLILTGALPEPRNLAAHGLFIAITVTALALRSARVQLVLALVGLVVFAGYIALLFTRLP